MSRLQDGGEAYVSNAVLKGRMLLRACIVNFRTTAADLEALETAVCYFNNERFPIGSYVLSGDELLSCEKPGVWVRKGEQPPRKDDVGA